MSEKKKSEEFIRRTLINYWVNENSKYQLSEDTINCDPECILNLDDLYLGEQLSDFQLETYKALED